MLSGQNLCYANFVKRETKLASTIDYVPHLCEKYMQDPYQILKKTQTTEDRQ